VAFERALQKILYALVDTASGTGDLAARDAGHAHRLHQRIDRAGRDAVYPGFLYHGVQRFFRELACF